jgi:hypothetical protein
MSPTSYQTALPCVTSRLFLRFHSVFPPFWPSQFQALRNSSAEVRNCQGERRHLRYRHLRYRHLRRRHLQHRHLQHRHLQHRHLRRSGAVITAVTAERRAGNGIRGPLAPPSRVLYTFKSAKWNRGGQQSPARDGPYFQTATPLLCGSRCAGVRRAREIHA